MVLHSQQPERYRSRVTLSTLDCKYMIYAEETALTTGTLHLQVVCSAFQSLPPVQDERYSRPNPH